MLSPGILRTRERAIMKTIEPDRPGFVDPPWFIRKILPPPANDRNLHEISHIVKFGEEPSDRRLAEKFDYVSASSDTRAEDNPRRFQITPGPPIPLWIINPIMVAVITVGVAPAWRFEAGWSNWFHTIAWVGFGSVAAIQFKSLMTWINQLKGTADYIVLDKITGEIVLPRVGLVLSKMEIKRIVELVPEGRRPHQVAVLIHDDAALQPTALWVYTYVFSSFGGTSSKLAKQFADALSMPLEKLTIPHPDA